MEYESVKCLNSIDICCRCTSPAFTTMFMLLKIQNNAEIHIIIFSMYELFTEAKDEKQQTSRWICRFCKDTKSKR